MKKIFFILALLLIGITAAEAQLISYSQTTRTKEKRKLEPVKPGYQQSIVFPVHSNIDNFFSTAIIYEGGYRFNNRFYFGIGVGFEYFLETAWHENYYSFYRDRYNSKKSDECDMGDVAIPLYATMRIYMSKKRFQPYFTIMAGGRLGLFDEEVDIYTGSKSVNKKYSTSSYMLEPGFGFDWRLSNKIALNFQMGYSLQSTPNFEGDRMRGKILYKPLSLLSARLGLTF